MANLSYLQIIRKCNQDCIFCSNPSNDNILSYNDAISAIDKFKEEGYDGIILTGGEPTLFDRLDDLIEYCNAIGFAVRIITNGQKLSHKVYFDKLIKSGLSHIHLSIYSVIDKVQAYLSNNKDSLNNIIKTLKNCANRNISVNINTVINKYNSDHLDKNVEWLLKRFPFINHFVWNNLDPSMCKPDFRSEVIPRFQDFEISLYKAAGILIKNKKTFRIERVPLCYMSEFADCSTETRKIVKEEYRTIKFLDFKGIYHQNDFFYDKPPVCKKCMLDSICAGIYEGEKYFNYNEIFPVFMNKDVIVDKIKNSEE